MLKRIIGILMWINFSLLTVAQTQADIETPKIVPPSPDAAALGKYGEIPVDKSTGIPAISIPIYEIKTPRFSLPISLSYHASGIRVEEKSSWIGAGWVLNAGGLITRSIKAFTDDEGYGILTNHTLIKKAADIQWPADISYIADVLNKRLDTEPDNFAYNFNNQSGSFAFSSDRKPVLVPYKPIKVDFNLSSKNFNIIDEQGNAYYFTTKEMVISDINNQLSGISSWYLTQMISADLSDTIKFIYTQDVNPHIDFSYNFSQSISKCGTGNTYQLQPMTTAANFRTYYPVRISSIIFKGGKVDFIGKTGRLDEGNVALDSVIVSNLNLSNSQYTRLKSFKLTHDYFYSTLPIPNNFIITISEANKHRLKLTGLQEIDATNTAVKTHQFDYNAAMLPQVHCFGQDNWGYFNGKINNLSLLESRKVILQPFPNASESIVQIGGNQGADRSVSETDMQAGVLEKITYPTKGYTLFEYEANKQPGTAYTSHIFSVAAFGTLNQGGVQEINTQNFTLTPEMINGGARVFTVKLSSGNNPYGSAIPFVKIVRVSDGAAIYNSADNASANTEINNLVLPLQANVQYAITAEAHGTTGGQVTSQTPYATITTNYKLPYSTLVNVGGLRVKSVKNYDQDGTMANTSTYKYGDLANLESGGGVQLAFFPIFHYSRATACQESASSLGYTDTYSNNSHYPLSTLSGSPVAYPAVTVYQGDSSRNIGKSIYKYNVYPDSILFSFGFWNGIKPISVTWKNGEPVWQGHYRNHGNNKYSLVSETFDTYEIISRKPAIGTIIGYNPEPIAGSVDCAWFSNPYVYNGKVWSGPCEMKQEYFYWFDYPISTGSRILKQRINKNFAVDGTHSNDTTNYFYDDTTMNWPTRTVSTDSRGLTIERYTYRPLQKQAINSLTPLSPTASLAIDSMLARNILGPVILQAEKRNGNITELSLSNYKLWTNNVIAPQNIQKKQLGSTLETRLLYNFYNQSGDVLEVQKASDLKEVYLWGYGGQYPVAKILNTSALIASGYITQSILDNPSDDVSLRNHLNNLRSIPGALVTTYTYQPLVGITSTTDPQGKTSFFEYDPFGRLKDIKDTDGNIIKTYDYHYAQ